MSPDVVYLLVAGKRIERFTSYTIDADMYAGASAFTLEMARPEIVIKPGMECQLYVNDALELTGIIDNAKPSYDKGGSKLTVTGRDLIGWMVDAHAEEFITLKDFTAKALAERLLKKAPKEFFNLTTVQYDENVKGRIKSRSAKVGVFDTSTPLSQIEPGVSVFDVLSQFAKSRGFLFYALPNGTFVFGRPKETGDAVFTLTNRLSGKGNNILSGDQDDDISKRYSKVTVVGQKQGQDAFSASQNSVEATVTDPTFPFYKPFILKDEYGGDQPKLQARLALEKMRHDGFKLNYSVKGHSQGNKNWSINEMAHVVDEDPYFALDGSFLLYGRTFGKSKDKGTTTKLRLGLPGMIA
jgi:prophage tail gpP-like protein